MTMANAHLVAALADPQVLELVMIRGQLQWVIFADKPVIREGYLELPNKRDSEWSLPTTLRSASHT